MSPSEMSPSEMSPRQLTPNKSIGLARWLRLCKKELLETLRDRRTLGTLLLMPLLVYPLLSMALNRFVLSSGGSTAAYRVAVETAADADLIKPVLNPISNPPPPAVDQVFDGQLAEFELFLPWSAEAGGVKPVVALEQGQVDLIARPIAKDHSFIREIEIVTRSGDANGENARQILLSRLQWWQIKRYGGATIDITVSTIGTTVKSSVLASLIPLVLVLMTITGAVYPAIDLTAGERERGTMEALMASPVPPFAVLTAKYVAVIAVAMVTAVANLTAMFVTLSVSGLMEMVSGGGPLPLWTFPMMFALLLLFATFFSAVLLSLTSYAKSFKEAQAYLIPVMLLSITPGMLALLPGIELAGPLAVVPLINIVLLARELLAGTATAAPAAIAVVSTLAYAAAALGVAAKLFGGDAASRSGSVSLAATFRRPDEPSSTPTPASAAFVLALLVPTYFLGSSLLIQYLGNLSASLQGDAPELPLSEQVSLQISSMWLSAIALWIIFGGVPALAAFVGRCRMASTYRMRRVSPMAFVSAALIGVGAWTIAHEAFVLYVSIFGGLDLDRITKTKAVLEAWTQVPPWIILTCLAATPAIVEELCFRGFLFSAFSKHLSPAKVILLTSAMFGLFHVLTGNALLFERFLPTTLLGLILGWVAWRSGSVWPGMVIHFIHNSLLTMLGHYHKQVSWFSSDFDDQTHLPKIWIVGGFCLVLIGAAILHWTFYRSRGDEVVPATGN